MRNLAGVVSLAAASACTAAGSHSKAGGDGGFAASTGSVVVDTAAANLPLGVNVVQLHLASIAARSDRDDAEEARLTLAGPLAFLGSASEVVAGAVPATYGRLELAAIDSLEIATSSGTVLVDFANLPPIELRCAGAGAYLGVSGQIGFVVTLDLTMILDTLSLDGSFPPSVPMRTVTAPAVTAAIYDALATDLALLCTE